MDARGLNSNFTYSGTLLMQSADALSNVTLYTYTTATDAPEPANLVRARRDPSGRVTRYSYNTLGQPLVVTTNYKDGNFDPNSPDEDLSTTYTYNNLGRVLTVTDPQGRVSLNAYNQAGLVTSTTRNYRADRLPYSDGIYNLTSATGYDAAGRVVTITSNLGSPLARTDWTCYDSVGRVTTDVVNASGPNACDAGYTRSSDPAYDRVTQTRYDSNGNVIATIDPANKITRTYYDELNRPIVVVQNLTGQPIETLTPPSYSTAAPDQNVRSQTVYDAAGNVQQSIDNAGQVTYQCYDELNRVVKTIQNPTVGNPCSNYTPSSAPDRDVIQQTVYDEDGNAIAMIDAAGVVQRTYYDNLNRPEYIAQNLVGQNIQTATPPTYDPQYPDRNIVSRNFYDASGRAYRQLDLTTSRSSWTCYDGLGRAVKQVQNATSDPCAPGYTPSTDADKDLVTQLVYDAAGNQIATIAPDGQVTRSYFNAAGQRIAQVVNLVGQPISSETLPTYDAQHSDRNLTALWGYDLAGRVITTTSAASSPLARTDWSCYDGFGRVVRAVSHASGANACDAGYSGSGQLDQDLIQQTVYDMGGQAIATIDPAGKITRTYFDGLQRGTTVVDNLLGQPIAATTAPAYDPAWPDRNLGQITRYDAGGRAYERVDNASMVTHTDYDAVGRPVTVIANFASGGPVNTTTNLRQITTYDKRGNPLQQQDANGIVSAYEYDALGRMTAVVENYKSGVTPATDTNVRTQYTYTTSPTG